MPRIPIVVPLLILAILSIAVVGPFADVPVVDDFFHKRVVDESLEAGRYITHSFIGSTIVLQVAWGAIFTTVFGEGYVPLRFSTLILGIAGAWVVARCARDFGASWAVALIAALCVWANPIYLLLAHSYMTDVPFFFLVAMSMWMQARGFLRESPGWLAAGIAMGVAAFFVRQHGFAAVMAGWTAAIYVLVIERRPLPRPMWIAMAASTGVGVVCIALWMYLYPFTESQSTWIGTGDAWPLSERIPESVWFLAVALAYVGLWAAPVVLMRLIGVRDVRWWATWGVAFVCIAVVSIAFSRGMTRMPYLPDYVYDFGVGQLTFSGTSVMNRAWKPFTIGAVWWGPTIIAIAGAAIVLRDGIALLFSRDGDMNERNARLFIYVMLAAFTVGYVPFLPRAFSDRYLLTALAPAVVVVAMNLRSPLKREVWVGAVAAAIVFIIGTLMTRDYFAMTEARWAASDWLIDDHGADPLTVDGGYEFNGIYTMDHFIEETGAVSFTQMGDHGYWLTDPPTYAIDLLERNNFEVIHRESYTSWLPPKRLEVLVLERSK